MWIVVFVMKLVVMEMKWGLILDMGGMVFMFKLMCVDEMWKLIYMVVFVLGDEV